MFRSLCSCLLFSWCFTSSAAKEEEWADLKTVAPTVKPFTFDGISAQGIVTKVLDGDTVQVVVKRGDNWFESHRVRLTGIDAPEIHPKKDSKTYNEEKEAGFASKKALEDKLAEDDNYVKIAFSKDDKYGRRLGTLFTRGGENLNEWMLSNGYAYAYDGGSKTPFELQ
jgi:endonuclease YncB( thermonuclease family)